MTLMSPMTQTAGGTVPIPYRVVGRHPETTDTATFVLEPADPAGVALPGFRPGRFAMIYAFGVGEIPVSVSGIGPGHRLTHTVRAVGAVSTALYGLRPGGTVGVRGPFGTGWDLPNAAGGEVLVVAGGIGLAPLRPLVREAVAFPDRYGRTTVLIGARTPTRAELKPLAERLRRALDDAWETVRWVAGFEFPDGECDADLLALAESGSYAIESGTPTVLPWDSPTRRTFPVHEFTEHVVEEHLPHSTALHARLDGRRHLTGSLARYAISGRWLSPAALDAAREAGLGDPRQAPVCRNPFRSILIRAVEVVHAVEEALRIIDAYEPPPRPYLDVPPRAGTGHGATEAPRGLLYHRYSLTADGTVTDARLVPPTAQNQGAIEEDLRRLAQRRIASGDPTDAELTDLCERAIRNHDPCISCSTHFLDLTVERH